MTTRETAKTIRVALKSNGWNSRKVSVRVRDLGISSAVDITIKCASVNPAKVREIVEGHQHIDRCEISGEILGGGNLYTSIDFAPGVLASVYGDLVTRLEAGEVVHFEDWTCQPSSDSSDYFIAVHPDHDRDVYTFGAEHCARQVAEHVLSA